MQLHVSTGDGVPIDLQIAHQIKYLVAFAAGWPRETRCRRSASWPISF